VDLWWSAKCDNHGGNVQVITAPDGWPLWPSDVRPGREHDTTALREHVEVRPLLAAWTDEDLRVLGDLGYEGEADTITVAFRKPKGGQFKTTFKALRNVSLCPWKIGKITAAALVLLHIEHDRTT